MNQDSRERSFCTLRYSNSFAFMYAQSVKLFVHTFNYIPIPNDGIFNLRYETRWGEGRRSTSSANMRRWRKRGRHCVIIRTAQSHGRFIVLCGLFCCCRVLVRSWRTQNWRTDNLIPFDTRKMDRFQLAHSFRAERKIAHIPCLFVHYISSLPVDGLSFGHWLFCLCMRRHKFDKYISILGWLERIESTTRWIALTQCLWRWLNNNSVRANNTIDNEINLTKECRGHVHRSGGSCRFSFSNYPIRWMNECKWTSFRCTKKSSFFIWLEWQRKSWNASRRIVSVTKTHYTPKIISVIGVYRFVQAMPREKERKLLE